MWVWRLRARWRYRNHDRHFLEEVDFHRSALEAKLQAEGLPPHEARRQAARVLGNVRSQREAAREGRLGPLLISLDQLWRDLRQAGRRLVRSPTFTLFSILTLALGIGSTTAVYSAVQTGLGPMPGVPNIERVVNVQHTEGGSIPMIGLSWPDYVDLRDRQRVFDRLAVFTADPTLVVTPGYNGPVLREVVSGDYFEVLGVRARVGRLLSPADDQAGAPPAAVISDRFWERAFNRSTAAIGGTIRLNDWTYTVVGVTDPAFAGAINGGVTPTSIWTALDTFRSERPDQARSTFDPSNRRHRWALVRGRLAPGVTVADAQAAVSAIAGQLDLEAPLLTEEPDRPVSAYGRSRPWVAKPAGDGRVGESTARFARPLAYLLFVIMGMVLLVACTNLANLSLARWAARRQELAVRMAMGASRWRVIRELASESLLLTVAGSAAGLWLASLLLNLIGTELPLGRGFSLQIRPVLDVRSLLAATGATVLALLVAGLVPAFRTTGHAVSETLASEGVTATPRWRGRRYLITLQVALSGFLVVQAGVAVQELWRQAAVHSSVDLPRLALAQVDFPRQGYEPERARQLVDAVTRLVSSRPGVVAAAASGLPSGPRGLQTVGGATVRVDSIAEPPRAGYVAATPGIFDALGHSIAKGRSFGDHDTAESDPVAVLTANLATRLFGDDDPLGRIVEVTRGAIGGRTTVDWQARRVVGVVRQFEFGHPDAAVEEAVFVPLSQAWTGQLLFVARTRGNPEPVVASLQQAIRAVDPDLGIVQAGTGLTLGNDGAMFYQIAGALAAILGAFALILALTGLHGVLSQVVSVRTREIGLRRALGVPTGRLYRSVLAEGLAPVVLGLIVGLGLAGVVRVSGALPYMPAARLLMPGVDVLVVAGVVCLFLAAGAVAVWGPARRAARVDPTVALKQE